MINTPYKQLQKGDNQISPGLQFLIFAGIFLVIFFVGNVAGIGIVTALYGVKTITALGALDVTAPHFITALWIVQTAGTTLPIFIAPVFFAYVIVRDPQDYIKPTFHFPWALILLVFLIMFISNPLIEFLSNLNEKMVLPPFLKWMRESEDNAQKVTQVMLHMNTVWDMISNVLFIGLLTAVVEELMFRGVIQTIFVRWTNNIHVAVWITAILFSAFHIEFFGFLPRLLLGVFFGYFVAWSGSIWTGVWAHFINNGTAVVVTYLFQQKIVKVNPDDQHMFDYKGYVFSVIVVLFLLFIYRKIALEKKPIAEY